MIKVLHKFISLSVSVFVLTSCTDNGLLFRSFGGYAEDDNVLTYKIGEAYQIKNEWYTPREDYTYNEKGIAGWYQEENGHLTANGEKYDEEALTAMHKTLPLPSVVRITNLENGNVAIVRVNERGPYVNNRLIDVSQKTAEALEFNMVGTTMVQVEILPEESKLLKNEILKKYGGQMEEVNVNGSSVLKSDVQVEALSEPRPLYQPDENAQVIYSQEIANQSNETGVGKIVSITQPPVNIENPNLPKLKEDVLMKNEITDPQPDIEHAHQLIQPISGHYIQAGAFSNPENAKKLKASLEQFGPSQIYEISVNEDVLHRVRMGPFETWDSAKEMLNKLNEAGYPSKIIFEP